MTVNLIVGMGFLLILLGLTVLDTRSKRAHEFRMAQLDREDARLDAIEQEVFGDITTRTVRNLEHRAATVSSRHSLGAP